MSVVDTIYEVETPEGIMLSLRVAGLPARAWAFIIDFAIRSVINIAIYILYVMFLGEDFTGLILCYFFLMEWFYPVFFEVKTQGRTPLKKMMNVTVLHGDGSQVRRQASCIRNFLLVADFMPFFYGFGMRSSLLDRRVRRLGDMAADTIVVYDNKVKKRRLPAAEPVMPPIALNIEEQRAIIAFAERDKLLSRERLEELAEILQPITQKKKKPGVKILIAYANALAGRSREKKLNKALLNRPIKNNGRHSMPCWPIQKRKSLTLNFQKCIVRCADNWL